MLEKGGTPLSAKKDDEHATKEAIDAAVRDSLANTIAAESGVANVAAPASAAAGPSEISAVAVSWREPCTTSSA